MSEHQLKEPAKKVLTAEEFMSRSKPVTKSIHVAELGGEIVIRAITLREREDIKSGSANTLTGKIDEAGWVALTIIKGLADPKLTPQHVADLQQSNFGVLARIAKQIWRLSGVDEDIKND